MATIKKIYLAIVLGIVLASFSALAERVNFIPAINDREEVHHLGYKFSNTSNIIISTTPAASCAWKPDSQDDGWKTCEAIFDIENQNQIRPRINDPILDFNFSVDNVRNKEITFSNTFILINETIYNQTSRVIEVNGEPELEIREENYTFTRRQFSDF